MADISGESSQPEGNFENDFEKLDPYSPESNMMEDEQRDFGEVTSSSQINADMPEEDLYTSNSPMPSEAEPLVDFGEPVTLISQPPIPEPEIEPSQPVTSSTSESEKTEEASPTPEISPMISIKSKTDELLKSVDPRVLDLIYWRDVKKTGVVFGSLLVVLLSLALFSVLSVIAYLSLAALTVTVSFRIYKNVLGAVQKTGEGHPFKEVLEVDISLPEDKVHEIADCVMSHASCTLRELRRLFLVEDMIDSIKFGLVLWVLTYIGAWFNGMTLIILAVVAVFSLPKVYETHQTQIDQYINLISTQVRNVIKQVQEKIPLPGKKKAA